MQITFHTVLLIINVLSPINVAGEINLMPPATPAKGNTLIFDALAISTVEGELHEGLSRQYEAVRVGIEGDSCFVKFTERVNMPHSGLSGRWARSVKANCLHRADLKC